MIKLEDSTEVKARPEKVFAWLVQRMKEEGQSLKRALDKETNF